MRALDEDIARMLNPPEYKPLEQYFLTINVSSHYPGADRALVQYISGMHLKITAILRFAKSDVEKARGFQAETEKPHSYKDARE